MGSRTRCMMEGTGSSPSSLSSSPSSGEAELVRRIIAGVPDRDRLINDVACGHRFVAVRVGDRVGLSSTLGQQPDGESLSLSRQLVGKPLDLATRQLSSQRLYARSLGLAAVCAGLDIPGGPRVDPGNIEDLLVREAAGREVAVVGDFPFWPRVRDSAGRAHLLELRARPEAAPQEQWPEILAACDLVAVTSTALLTRSLAWFLASAAGARVVLVGPSTPFSPALFGLGVHVLAGSEVLDGPAVSEGVAEGLPFRQLKRRGVRQLAWSYA